MSNTCTVEQKSETKPSTQHLPTLRIQVDLFEPTERRYPVFNYQKLLIIEEKKRRKRDQQSNSFDDNDETIKLTEHFESKNGCSGVKKKKKKKTAFYNYSELAAGYDENDSFIDNTETFNKIMSEEFETEHGGYYVNSGSLEFKEVFLSKDSEEIKSSQPRKNYINNVLEDIDEELSNFAVSNNTVKHETKTSETSNDSSSSKLSPKSSSSSSNDDDDDEEEKETSKSICPAIFPVNGKSKRRQSIDSDSANSIIPTKKKKISTVKSLIQEKRGLIPECKPSCSKDTQITSSEDTPLTENNISSINETIESVINAARLKPLNVAPIPEKDVMVNQIIINPKISIDVPVSNGVHYTGEKLPEIIVEIIESIKTEAQIAIQNNLNIFSEQINLYLLSLEYQKELVTFDSEPIYATLAEFMFCEKEELVKQVNQLVDSEEAKIIDPIKRLKDAIEKVLPSVIEQYNLECNKVLDQRTVNGTFINGLKSKPGPKRPRRKFPWNEEFRTYVRDIIYIRTTTYSKIKRSCSIDVYIERFIDGQIKPLWPDGWMKSYTNILKELQVKEKDSKPKLSKKQPLQNSPVKLISAIKMASEHKVSNSAMNKLHKLHKWKKQKSSKMTNISCSGTTTTSASHTTSQSPSTTSNLKQVYNSPHSVTITTLSNDMCPYQATITTTAINGSKQKDPEKNSVIVKTEALTGDVLDLSPNKSSLIFTFNKSKDNTVISNNTSSDNNISAKSDLQINPKNMVPKPITLKQRLLQKHNTPDQQSTKPKDEKYISSANKDCIKVEYKSTATDIVSQIINESLMDNTSPLPSQFTTNHFYKSREETKLPLPVLAKQDIKSEFLDWQHTDQNTLSRTSSNQLLSSLEVKKVEKETQEVIKELAELSQLSSSCSSRNTRDNNTYKKHMSSVSMYSSNSPDPLVSSPLGVIHHPAYRNSYSTSSSKMCQPRNESTYRTASLGIPKMSIDINDKFLKHLVKTAEPSSRSSADIYQTHGVQHFGLIQTNAQSSENLYQQQFYSTLDKKPNQEMSHNSITAYSNTNE